jgi:hypothetical protein
MPPRRPELDTAAIARLYDVMRGGYHGHAADEDLAARFAYAADRSVIPALITRGLKDGGRAPARRPCRAVEGGDAADRPRRRPAQHVGP